MIYAPICQINKFIPDIPALKTFLKDLTPEEDDGIVNILSKDIFAVTSTYKTKEDTDAVLESHSDYVDVQIVLDGEELGKVTFTDGLSVTEEQPEKDLIIYRKPAKFAAEFLLHKGVFAVFFNYDAHITQLIVPKTGKTSVKKTVLKIKATFL